jgi:hypothetical protein
MKSSRHVITGSLVAAGLLACATADAQMMRLMDVEFSLKLKPGFAFDPDDCSSLAAFAMEIDELDADQADAGRLSRELLLSNGTDDLRIVIGVSQNSVGGVRAFMRHFGENAELDAAERLVNGSQVGLAIGEDSRVGNDSTSASIEREVAFRRQNIFVSIQLLSEDSLNLLPIASQIDAAIQALPDVTLTQLQTLRPEIVQFSAADTSLHPYEATDLTVSVTNPGGDTITKTYVDPDGDVELGSPDRYRAGGRVGTQTLQLVVSRPNLLFDSAGVDFQVVP